MSAALYSDIVPGQVWRCIEATAYCKKGELVRVVNLQHEAFAECLTYERQDGAHKASYVATLRRHFTLEPDVAFVRLRQKPPNPEQQRKIAVDMMIARSGMFRIWNAPR